MTFLVVANFKSNKNLAEVESWITSVAPTPGMVIAPTSSHLNLFADKSFVLAGQDVSQFPPGSYTGAVNSRQLKDLGVSYCIVGHSERRRYFHETPADVAGKVRELLAVGITPILCMEEGDIAPQFAALDDEYYSQCIYCFEPAADIGGVTTAPSDLIVSVKDKIVSFVPGAKFMYGGSVTGDNITSLLPLNLTGVLVATASLNPQSFLSIIDKIPHAS
ncbi:MAG: triose-phosphate isomerase family protein [bacterium]